MAKRKQSDVNIYEYLRGRSGLSRTYRETATEQPAPWLDREIIHRARSALTSRGRWLTWILALRAPFSSSWALPVALTAVLALSVTAAIFFGERGTIQTLSQRIEPSSADEDLRVMSKEAELSTPGADGLGDARQPSSVAAPAPELAQPSNSLQNAAPVATQNGRRSAAEPLSKKARPALEEKRTRSLGTQRNFDQTKAGALRQKTKAEEALPPEVWLEQILALRQQGKNAEATDALQAFKQYYPDYPLDKLMESGGPKHDP